MLNRLMSCGAVLMLLAVATPVAAQDSYCGNSCSDRDLLNLPNSGGLSYEDRSRLDELKEGDAKYTAAVVAEVELRRKLLRLPPLPDERNVLLGSWRQENGGQRGMLGLEARNGDDMVRELWEALQSNPDKLLPSRCVATFGNGVTFAPSTYTSSALDGSRPGGPIAYRSGGNQVIWVIPDNLKPMPFKIVGPDRILLGIDGSGALVRVGTPAANAAANATIAPGNARAAASGPSSPPADAATPTSAAGRAREPIAPTSRLGRGVQLHGEKDFQPALQELLVAAQSDPNDPRVYVYLADTYAWLGLDKEANQAAERAKQLDPNAFDILR
ncbi:MAG: hypothetical protein NTZ61_06185 [Proteobacteria bacterium]|nr:hypothetical protein [Pseudomonadota bacterium]